MSRLAGERVRFALHFSGGVKRDDSINWTSWYTTHKDCLAEVGHCPT
jgi:hypothetical protein